MVWLLQLAQTYATGGMLVYGTSALLALIAYVIGYTAFARPKEGTIKSLGGFSVFTAWTFFTRRYDFIAENFKKIKAPHFKFNVLHHQVVALRGEHGRRSFFDAKNLDLPSGYAILMGAVPNLKDVKVKGKLEHNTDNDVSQFNKIVNLVFTNKRRLEENLPPLFEDVNRRMCLWGKEGRVDPFKVIYEIVFQMTVRMASCTELATNMEELEDLQKHYWALEKSATPVALLLPWFPSQAKKTKKAATTALFTKLAYYVELRRAAKVPTSDAIDLLIAQGLSTPDMVQFILSVIFAGVINTGMISSWTVMYLGTNPEWRAKVKAEVDAIIEKYTEASSGEPLHKRLAAVPVSVWEDEMPSIDLVIRETQRIVVTGTALRRNISSEMTAAGGIIKQGDFLAYSVADAHYDPTIYTNPTKFDPDRFLPGREEDKKSPMAFLGWGAGRHPCSGMRIAKLEIKLIVAMMLGAYDFTLVDSAGRLPKQLPQPDKNDLHQARPLGEQVYLQFKRMME